MKRHKRNDCDDNNDLITCWYIFGFEKEDFVKETSTNELKSSFA